MSDDIGARLGSVFRDVFMDDGLVIRPEMTAEDLDEWDSVTHISLVYAIEEEFGVEFAADDIQGLANVGELERVIRDMVSR